MKKAKISMFYPEEACHKTAMGLFESASDLPLICPHTHLDPWLFVDGSEAFKDPASLFVTPDHYVLRMLISHGISFTALGHSPLDSDKRKATPQAVWQVFCDHFSLFDGTPTGLWIENALAMVFEIDEKPHAENAQALFSHIQSVIDCADFCPQKLYQAFNIEDLSTTDAALESLDAHRAIRESSWGQPVRPTFRPDQVIDIGHPEWRENIDSLSRVCDLDIGDFCSYIQALEQRRVYFKAMGAVATDLGAEIPFTCCLSDDRVEAIFQRGLVQKLTSADARLFKGHMITEMARMSVEDGLVMQFHVGAFRNHNPTVFRTYGPDLGFDIPVAVEWTHNLKPLLDAFGMDERLRLILFTLDESGYARELAPIAGAYPAVKLGPPWWFHDSPNGMMRYFEAVMETAGIDNTVGFNDDTRAFLSIPTRHDLWRRMSAHWLAKLVHRGQIDIATAHNRMVDLAYGLVKRGYRLV